jgi:antitoxin (DNA-binding transcriptional repressor) of toxin-antitoxin stability system
MQFNIHYAKTNLSRLLELVERGEEVVIARAGKPVGRIVLCEAASPAPTASPTAIPTASPAPALPVGAQALATASPPAVAAPPPPPPRCRDYRGCNDRIARLTVAASAARRRSPIRPAVSPGARNQAVGKGQAVGIPDWQIVAVQGIGLTTATTDRRIVTG